MWLILIEKRAGGMNVKALALDLDGTVFGDGELNLDEVVLLRMLQEKGVKVILCTGRNLHYVLGIARCLGTDGPVICEEGTIVYDQSTHARMFNGELSDLNTLRENLKNWLPTCVIPKEAHHDKEIILALDRNPRVDLDLFVEEVKAVLEERKMNLVITRSDEMINIMPQGVDKGVGLSKALEILDIDQDNVIAVGDAPNDLPLIKEAGYGIAVSNAHEKVKDESDYVTNYPDGRGVIEVINLILSGSIP